jgi:putative copper export protein
LDSDEKGEGARGDGVLRWLTLALLVVGIVVLILTAVWWTTRPILPPTPVEEAGLPDR